jgi:hypothetical protein
MSSDPNHDRHWPRDAPIRWGTLGRRFVLWGVVLASALAHIVLAGLYVRFLSATTTGELTAWMLAIAWIALAGFLVWNWWFFRWRIVLAPAAAAVLLWLAMTLNL